MDWHKSKQMLAASKMKIIVVRIGDKYGQEYEDYLESKLSEYELHWIREPYHPEIKLQWNKMWGMQLDIDEPICVMDIDILLMNDYKEIFEYPIKKEEFLAMPGWWRDTKKHGYYINGGFFKYYPKDCKYIYDKFMSDIQGWQRYYIANGVTNGPVNGEQYFVEDSVNERLELKLLPNEWFTRWVVNSDINYGKKMSVWQVQITRKYRELTGNEYVCLGEEFHPDIKLVHFTHSENKPHNWSGYDKHN